MGEGACLHVAQHNTTISTDCKLLSILCQYHSSGGQWLLIIIFCGCIVSLCKKLAFLCKKNKLMIETIKIIK